MSSVKNLVDSKIEGKKVMVFSKSFCPYCKLAKEALSPHIGSSVSSDQVEFLEIDGMSESGQIQDYLLTLTGGRTVPRVFINQKFVGGGSELRAMAGNGQLKELLSN